MHSSYFITPPSGSSFAIIPGTGPHSNVISPEAFDNEKNEVAVDSIAQSTLLNCPPSTRLNLNQWNWKKISDWTTTLNASIAHFITLFHNFFSELIMHFHANVSKEEPVLQDFNAQAEEHFNAINHTVFKKNITLLADFFVNHCDLDLLTHIVDVEELKQLLAANLFLEVSLPDFSNIPCGLSNIHNSCYRNATNQMLLHSPFAKQFTAEASAKVVEEMLQAHPEHPQDVLEKISIRLKVSIAFKQLANIYYQMTVQGETEELRKEMMLCNQQLVNVLVSSSYMPDLNEEDRNTQQDAAAYLEALILVFANPFTLKINKFNEERANEEKALVSLLQIPLSAKTSTLQGLIDKYFQPSSEVDLFGDHKGFIETVQLDDDLPDQLFVQLKRRQYLDERCVFDDSFFSFPPEGYLDFSQAREGGGGERILYGITGFTAYIPYGSEKSGLNGHYISFVQKDKGWYRCDDNLVTLASEGELAEAQKNIYTISLSKE